MIHHQKSSKSSEEELEINLLKQEEEKKNQRDSRINFNRVREVNLPNRISPPKINNRLRTGSQHQPRARQSSELSYFEDDNVMTELQKLEQLGHNKYAAFSESMLTESNSNNNCIGFILFLTLIAFTPLETLSFVYVQPLSEQNLSEVLINVLAAQLISFSVIYYCSWIQKIKLKRQLFYKKRRSPSQDQNFLQRLYQIIFTRPLLAIPAIFAITLIWEISYCQCLRHTQQANFGRSTDIQLIFIYITLLPQISTFIYYQDSMLGSSNRRKCLLIIVAYLLICSAFADIYLLLTAFFGILLIILSIKLGRIVSYVEYASKFVIILYLLGIKMFRKQEYNNQQPSFLKRLGIILLMAFSALLVRCINNKILRNQLYRYFYTDSFINCFLLLIPPLLGFFDQFDRGYQLIFHYFGLICLIYISYMVGKDRDQVKMPSVRIIQQPERQLRSALQVKSML